MKPRGHRRRTGRTTPTALAVCVLAWLLAGEIGRVGAQTPSTPTPTPGFVPNELIVRLRDGGSGAKLTALFSTLRAIGVKTFETVDGLYVISLPAALDVQTAGRLAKTLDSVAYAEPNYIVTTGTIPNDTSFGELWGLHNTGQSGGTADADIDAPEAWDITTGSSAVVVAVIDTGIDYTHPDLAANMFRNEADCNSNGVDDDGNGYIDDCYGIDTANNDTDPMDDHRHGTHTAGTIGAAGNNGVGVVGVNWQVKLMPCKFLGAIGSGSTANAITCLEYVANMKARGVNIVATSNSWGGGGFSQALYDAIEVQRVRGILFIAAAGNSTSNNDTTANYPSNVDLPNVIAVASTTRTDSQSSFSNYGRRTVHLGAPGSEILSTTINNTYSSFSGTSMATPHVAGVAALLKAQDPARDWRAIRNLILAGGDSTAAMNGNTVTGKRLNAFGSMTCSNATVFSRLKPVGAAATTTVGTPVTVSALNIRCAAGDGNVAVTVSPGNNLLTLVDDGVAPDQAGGDGIYSGSFVPAAIGTFVLTFPDSTTQTIHALSSTPYTFQSTAYNYRQITGTSLGLGDDTSASITLPFPVSFGGTPFTTLFVSSNGSVRFTGAFDAYANEALPTNQTSNLIAPFWDDLVAGITVDANVFWAVTGSAPSREVVVEWRDVTGYLFTSPCPSTEAITFQVVFFEGLSDVLFNYADATFGGSCSFRDQGASATVGIQTSPSVARQHSYNSVSVADGSALLWTLLGQPGTFTDTPLTVGATNVKAVHITELRARIDTQRIRFGLAARAWTNPSLVAGVTMAKALHLLEMRTALSEAYQAAELKAPSFTGVIQAGQTAISAAHIAELRAAVVALEAR